MLQRGKHRHSSARVSGSAIRDRPKRDAIGLSVSLILPTVAVGTYPLRIPKMTASLAEAIAAAQRRYGEQWSLLSPAEQTSAIYQEMRRLDSERGAAKCAKDVVKGLPAKRKPPGRRFEPPPTY